MRSQSLPQPERERWQPLRAGLVDVFYYDQEEFRFRDGRLLLRGNNGTGKSKVLALTLPFLLDGELSPHRVEPDADPKKRMDWNLLLGGEHPNPERLGYTWLELGRLDTETGAQFCTLGCGLKALSGRGISDHWFFISDQRIGEDLTLVDRTQHALTRDRLEDEIGTHGGVHRTARAYRRAVDEALFALGEQRYAALIDLLIKIRAPQLSKRPDERHLSAALTGALPPLDQALIADVAEAFRGLEEDRNALAAMVQARDAAIGYLDTYRHYARIACRRRAAPPRRSQTVFDRISRELAEAQAAYEKACAELIQAQEALATLRTEQERLGARERALHESPEARSARELQRAAEDARRAAELAAGANSAHEQALARVRQQQQRLTDADARAAQAGEDLTRARAAAVEQALAAGIATAFSEAVDSAIDASPARVVAEADEGERAVDERSDTAGASEATESGAGQAEAASNDGRSGRVTDVPELRRRAERLVERQQRAIDHLATLLAAAVDRRRELLAARERHEERASEATVLAERREQAGEQVAQAGRELGRAARLYLETTTAFAVSDASEPLAALELWVETLSGPNPLAEVVGAAGRQASAALARKQTELESGEREATELASELEASIERLRAGGHELPPAPHTRDPLARERRPGAPLWLLVDFCSDVPEQRRAGIEAALEASGILDAWVSPDGELLAPGTSDVLLAPEAGDGSFTSDAEEGSMVRDARDAGARLKDVLEPALDPQDPQARAVGEEAVRRVLAAVALAREGPVWVTPEGEFRNGVLRGAWSKPRAAFIGRGARETARRARLAELERHLAEVKLRLQELEAARERLRERGVELERQLRAMPSDEPLRGAHGKLAAVDGEQVRLAEHIAKAAKQLEQAQTAMTGAESAMRESASELGLPEEPAALKGVRVGLQALGVALAGLWPAIVALDRAREAVVEAGRDVECATREALVQDERRGAAEREASERIERHDTLAQTVGAAVAELQRQLADVATDLRANEHAQAKAEDRRSHAQTEKGKEDGRREQLTVQFEQATEQRLADVDALRRFASTGLIAVALGDVELPEDGEEWSVTAGLRVARLIEQELADAPDDEPALQRASRRVTDELNVLGDALRRHGNNASATMPEEGIVVEVVFRGHSTTVPELASALAEEVGDRERLLDEREREILENHLVGEVAGSLQELISDAEHRVEGVNGELADRPTSTGMRLRLRWRVAEDGPPGLAEARERLLRQSADAWSEEDRSAVGAFLQAQIQEVRSRDVAGTWIEQLTEALDYRAWHRFAIERHQGGAWRSATGPASGGERVLTASVPLFAAASSYYASAGNPHAPRLVMLDEAFAGVDDDSRAKCFGLLTSFDLDVVMTSEREWGCYREVPGLAIAQLARMDGIPAVLVSHWEWDGATRKQVERPVAAVAAPAEAEAEATGNGGLLER
ncbi:MAG TPA: TIGR02680 family protein [Solirubrobacteraceae bacterium]|jgi:uncharacterized protein (TIGR02680 family)|nr:TIGR02680 family protein [Solirubrobacteraceae bacterium]